MAKNNYIIDEIIKAKQKLKVLEYKHQQAQIPSERVLYCELVQLQKEHIATLIYLDVKVQR